MFAENLRFQIDRTLYMRLVSLGLLTGKIVQLRRRFGYPIVLLATTAVRFSYFTNLHSDPSKYSSGIRFATLTMGVVSLAMECVGYDSESYDVKAASKSIKEVLEIIGYFGCE